MIARSQIITTSTTLHLQKKTLIFHKLMIKQCLIVTYRSQTLAVEMGHWSNIKCQLHVFSNFIKIKNDFTFITFFTIFSLHFILRPFCFVWVTLATGFLKKSPNHQRSLLSSQSMRRRAISRQDLNSQIRASLPNPEPLGQLTDTHCTHL